MIAARGTLHMDFFTVRIETEKQKDQSLSDSRGFVRMAGITHCLQTTLLLDLFVDTTSPDIRNAFFCGCCFYIALVGQFLLSAQGENADRRRRQRLSLRILGVDRNLIHRGRFQTLHCERRLVGAQFDGVAETDAGLLFIGTLWSVLQFFRQEKKRPGKYR